MTVVDIRDRFFEIQSTKYSNLKTKQRDFIKLRKKAIWTKNLLDQRASAKTLPTFLKWEYQDLMQFICYIDSEILDAYNEIGINYRQVQNNEDIAKNVANI